MKIDEEIIKAWEELKKKKLKEKERDENSKKEELEEEKKEKREKKEEEKIEEKIDEGNEVSKESEKESEEKVDQGIASKLNNNALDFSIEIGQDFNIESSEIRPPILISEGTKKEQERLEEKALEGTFKRNLEQKNEKQFYKNEEKQLYKNKTFYESEKYEIKEIADIAKELRIAPAKIEKMVIKDGIQEIAENMQKETKLLEMQNRIIETTEIKPEEFFKEYEYNKYESLKFEDMLKIEKIKRYE